MNRVVLSKIGTSISRVIKQSVIFSGALVIALSSSAIWLSPLVHADQISIDDCVELQKIGYDEAYLLNGDYILSGDINCSDTINWNEGDGFAPIGTYYNSQMSPTSFTGTFNGQGHTISGLYINRPSLNNIGLFGVIDDGSTVENFTLSGVDITGNWYVGAVAGGLVGHLENVHASGLVNGNQYAGGLVGQHVPIDNLDNSSPLVYTWNGEKYTYTNDVGDMLPRDTNGEDLAQIDKNALVPKDGKYSMKITQEYNEIVYYDQLSLMTFDHQPGYTVVSPLFRNTTRDNLRTIKDEPTNPLRSCIDKYGNDCKQSLGQYDDKWSYKDSSKVNYWIMDFGDLSASKDENVQLVMRGARNYEQTPESKLRTVQVKDELGNWVEVYNKNDIGSDGTPRLRTIDLTGKFLSNDYQVKVGFDTLQANYFAIDTSPQVPVDVQTHSPESVNLDFHGFTKIDRTHFNDHNYYDVSPEPATQFKNQYGKFTKYGDVTPLLRERDDHFAIMRYGDQLNVEFAYSPVPDGKERSFILDNQVYYKHASLGELGTKVEPLPYRAMGTYGLDTNYPMTTENKEYLNTWNTREYVGNDNPTSSTIVDSSSAVDVIVDGCNVGGVVGYNRDKDIIGTTASGAVQGFCYVGGIAGRATGQAEISQSSATGDVSAEYDTAGGVVGYASGITIDQSYSTGNVEGSSYIGGIVGGGNTVAITDSYSRGNVTGSGDSIGGIVGRADMVSSNRTYSTGAITSTGSAYVGGVFGYFNIDKDGVGVKDSFATGARAADSAAAGLTGVYSFATGPVMDNGYWNHTTADDDAMSCYGYEAEGVAFGNANCTKIEDNVDYFKSSTNGPMSEWNFDTVWAQFNSVNGGFPCLQWDEDCVDNATRVTLTSAQNGAVIELEQNGCAAIDSAVSVKESALEAQDPGFDYPLGLLNYTLSGCDLGVASVRITVVGSYDIESFVVRKFNQNTLAFTSLNSETDDVAVQETTYNGDPAVLLTLNINDGGSLDEDGEVNGTIVDPVGLATQEVGVPNTGLKQL